MQKSTAACIMVLAVTATLLAAGRGTPSEARAMLHKAIAHYESVGRKQALADFNIKKPPFGDRDLYVLCIGPDHTIVADGGFPQYVGLSADFLKDTNGKSVAKMGYDLVNSKGEGEVRYRWVNPVTHNTETKVSFFAKAGDDACAVGAYSPD